MTRTPDAHFFTEARYRGARVAAVAPDYAEYVKFADTWLPARAGTDAALALAMTHVIVREFYIDRRPPISPDMPNSIRTSRLRSSWNPRRHPGLRPVSEGRRPGGGDGQPPVENRFFMTVQPNPWVVPNGSIGFRWDETGGRWNLHLKDSRTDAPVDPLLSYAGGADAWRTVSLPYFDDRGTRVKGWPGAGKNCPDACRRRDCDHGVRPDGRPPGDCPGGRRWPGRRPLGGLPVGL